MGPLISRERILAERDPAGARVLDDDAGRGLKERHGPPGGFGVEQVVVARLDAGYLA